MCLLSVDEKPARKWGIGYKQVEKRRNGHYVCFDHQPHRGTVTYPLNRWLKDPNDGQIGLLRKYRTGFHISLDIEALTDHNPSPSAYFPIIKVRFRKVTATDLNSTLADCIYGRQVVAREIMNLGEVTK